MPHLVPASDMLVPVRIIVRDGSNNAVTNTTATDMPLSQLLAEATPAGVGQAGPVIQQAAQTDSAAADVAAVNVQFNSLLAKLRAAGILAT